MFNETLNFIGFRDFYKRSNKLKQEYQKLSLENKYHYKHYVYANPLMSDYYKDLIWEYLNGFIDRNELKKGYKKARC
ncbi:MAG TPA: hypothetical protein GX708_16900 [Gallicola sp.]|nr:hypothetical protein [Gallicola sp.]